MQLGGGDQWGNISAGIDLIRKKQMVDEHVYGCTTPLLTTRSGDKFGKSAGNAIWLSPAKTSPYDLYQFFLNQEDDQVKRLMMYLTFINVEQIEEISREHEVICLTGFA
jgi:tyrosyl-tRNA synthetase